MCDFNNLTEDEKLHYHEILLTSANNYGGKNFFLQLVETLREKQPHPLISAHQDFLFEYGDVRWGKTIFNDKVDLIKATRTERAKEKSFLPKSDEKKYKKILNLIRTLDPITFRLDQNLETMERGLILKLLRR